MAAAARGALGAWAMEAYPELVRAFRDLGGSRVAGAAAAVAELLPAAAARAADDVVRLSRLEHARAVGTLLRRQRAEQRLSAAVAARRARTAVPREITILLRRVGTVEGDVERAVAALAEAAAGGWGTTAEAAEEQRRLKRDEMRTLLAQVFAPEVASLQRDLEAVLETADWRRPPTLLRAARARVTAFLSAVNERISCTFVPAAAEKAAVALLRATQAAVRAELLATEAAHLWLESSKGERPALAVVTVDELLSVADTILGEVRARLGGGTLVPHPSLALVRHAWADRLLAPPPPAAVDYAAGYVVQSLVCAPVVDGGGRAIGAVELLNRLRDEEEVTPFDANDATALGLFAAIVGPCLERQLMADRHELWAGAAQ